MLLDIVILVVMAAVLIIQTHLRRQDEAAVRLAHAAELERAGESIQQLLAQVQANAQNMPYYPQIGPFPADTGPEPRYLASDDGLIVFEDYEADALDEVAP